MLNAEKSAANTLDAIHSSVSGPDRFHDLGICVVDNLEHTENDFHSNLADQFRRNGIGQVPLSGKIAVVINRKFDKLVFAIQLVCKLITGLKLCSGEFCKIVRHDFYFTVIIHRNNADFDGGIIAGKTCLKEIKRTELLNLMLQLGFLKLLFN